MANELPTQITQNAVPTGSTANDIPMGDPPAQPGMKTLKTGAAMLTWLGEPESNSASTTVGNEATGTLTFPIREPVLVDPASAGSKPERDFLTHIINKARGSRFFKVEDAAAQDGDHKRAAVHHRTPIPRTTPNPKRGAHKA